MNNSLLPDLHEIYRKLLASDNEALIDRMVSCSSIVQKKKGDIVFRPGATRSSTTILLDGVMKTFVLSPDGTENTFALYHVPGTPVIMKEDMINAAELWCKALTPCTLVEVYPGPYELADEFPELWEKLIYAWRPFYYGMMDKLRAGYTLNAKDRYLWFVEKHGALVDKISLNEIALYLGIKPQSLSRIRAELEKGGAGLENR